MRKLAVENVVKTINVSERRACRVINHNRSTQRQYVLKPNEFREKLTERVIELASNCDSTEKWYEPVDIGKSYFLDGVSAECLPADQFFYLFHEAGSQKKFSSKFTQELENEKQKYLQNFSIEDRKKNDNTIKADKDMSLGFEMKAFSASKVRIYVLFPLTHSRWHHEYKVLLDYIFLRNPKIDQFLSLKKNRRRLYFFD